MDLLPPELIHHICEHVPPADITSVRLTSKLLAVVATPLLLHEMHLLFRRDSFDRMIEISQHPVISREIKSLLYEPDRLETYKLRRDWEDRIFEYSYLELLSKVPKANAGKEEHALYEEQDLEQMKDRRGSPKQRIEKYSEELLAKGWASYQDVYQEQEYIRNHVNGSEELCNAMKNLPNLNAICMSLGSCIVPRSKHLDKSFSATLLRCGRLDPSPAMTGIYEMRSLLLGAWKAGLKLDSLRCGEIDWKFLQVDDVEFERFRSLLKSVRRFRIEISTGTNYDEEMGLEIPQCSEYLKNSRLWHSIKDTPLLESLTIGFDWWEPHSPNRRYVVGDTRWEPHSPADLRYAVGDTRWNALRRVDLRNLDTDEQTWNAFFHRHKETLRHVRFENIRLTSGEWTSALQNMHKLLKLTSARVGGRLLGDDPPQYWYLHPEDGNSSREMTCQSNRTRKAINGHLVGWGDCPLLDVYKHPNLW